MDVFHDVADAVASSARADVETLTRNGFAVQWIEQLPAFFRATAGKAGEAVRLEWAYDTKIWPVLGFVFLPLTTLAYATAMHYGGREWTPLGVAMVVTPARSARSVRGRSVIPARSVTPRRQTQR